jgi:hypothetical protein
VLSISQKILDALQQSARMQLLRRTNRQQLSKDKEAPIAATGITELKSRIETKHTLINLK